MHVDLIKHFFRLKKLAAACLSETVLILLFAILRVNWLGLCYMHSSTLSHCQYPANIHWVWMKRLVLPLAYTERETNADRGLQKNSA